MLLLRSNPQYVSGSYYVPDNTGGPTVKLVLTNVVGMKIMLNKLHYDQMSTINNEVKLRAKKKVLKHDFFFFFVIYQLTKSIFTYINCRI